MFQQSTSIIRSVSGGHRIRTERMCNNSGNVMFVNRDDMNSFRATLALQAIRLNSFCTHEILCTLAYQSAGVALC